MQKIESRFTVFFEDPFWVGLYERTTDSRLEVCKITFGPEPNNQEVMQFFSNNWRKLTFSPAVAIEKRSGAKKNPKRIQREINKLMSAPRIGTKAQQALKLQQEAGKESKKRRKRAAKIEESQRKYDLRRQKRKEKHKGK